MCPRKNNDKRQEREVRQQEKKIREKKAHGKEDDDEKSFNNQLRAYNLQLRDIIGDGNCLFRSFADQLDGDQHRHKFYREQICDYMIKNREDFEPFIVDQPFDAFIRSLSKNGTYGGNESIVAFSRLFDARICIHQLNQPVWTVCFSDSPKHEIHISYHDYEHYSSVRRIGDHTFESANVRQSMTTCDPSKMNDKPKKAPTTTTTELFTEHDIDYILSQLPNPVDRKLVHDTLTDNLGDVDQTITYLLTIDTSVNSPPIVQTADDSIERIMTITQVFDVELVQQSFSANNCDVDQTVESLLKMKVADKEEEEISETKTKNRPVSNRQLKIDKKKAKKQRAVEKHRAQILGTSSTTEKSETTSNEPQEPAVPANMEFINI